MSGNWVSNRYFVKGLSDDSRQHRHKHTIATQASSGENLAPFGVRAFAVAMIERAIVDATHGGSRNTAATQDDIRTATVWLRSKSLACPAFLWCCDVLQISPNPIRDWVRTKLAERLAKLPSPAISNDQAAVC